MTKVIRLPEPISDGELSLEKAMHTRRSIRTFRSRELSDHQRGQLLWAAQGLTDPRGYRTAPSAGALYPLEIYWLEKEGLFHYIPRDHSLEALSKSDYRTPLCKAAWDQEMIVQAPATMIFAAVFQRTQGKYGTDRGSRYVLIDLGHAAQNVLLQAAALGLGAVPLGAFNDQSVQALLDLPPTHIPLYLIPIGNPA